MTGEGGGGEGGGKAIVRWAPDGSDNHHYETYDQLDAGFRDVHMHKVFSIMDEGKDK